MMEVTKQTYNDRLNKVLQYIDAHLYEDLPLTNLAEVAFLSKYHFHRLFFTYVGLNVYQYIQLLRLKRASYQLVFRPEQQVIDIALDACFENPESFSRAFKKAFGQTPSQFRKEPAWQPWHEKYKFPVREGVLVMTNEISVEVVGFEEVKVAVLEHRKASELINESIRQVIDWRRETGLSPIKTSRTFGLAYDDPQITAPEDFRFDLCAEVQREVPENSYGMVNKMIPAGKCARIRHIGPYEQMTRKIYYLYGDWLAESAEELRDFPCFFHYVTKFPDVPESECITDIYLPLQ